MAEETTVKINGRGRLTIPQATRVALGINNEETWIRLRIEVVEPPEDASNVSD